MTTLKKYLSLFVLSLALLVPSVCVAGIIDEGSVRVTDVTTVQFAVVWGTSEAATGTVKVFADADGNIPVSQALINLESSAHPPAEDMGVIKVRVSNLQANTSYFFQIESTTKAGGIVSRYPEVQPFMRVITEKITSVVHNDILAQQVSIGAGKSTQGTLVIATVEQASYPVTGWAGNGVPEGWVAIDMNNFYDKVTHTNLELVGDGEELITFTFFCGFMGSVVTEDTVPPESGEIQSVKVAATLPGDSSGGGGDSTAPTSSSSGGGGGGGAACFIATASDNLFGL